MADTSIEWTNKVWNPTLGCERVSAGCGAADAGGCYAERLAFRLAAMGQREYAGLTHRLPDGKVRWTGKVICLPERLAQPLKWRKSARIFVDSMSDLFHEDVPDEFIDKVFAVMALAPRHTFQVLTKRPDRLRAYATNPETPKRIGGYMTAGTILTIPGALDVDGAMMAQWYMQGVPWPLPNVWLGTSVEDQRAADERIPLLLQTPAAVRFLSVEPMLGPVELDDWLKVRKYWNADDGLDHAPPYPKHWYKRQALVLRDWSCPIRWVICGGESGPNYRPLDLNWIRSLRDQCKAAGVAFFAKQNSGPRTHMWLPEDLQSHEFPEPAQEMVHG